jgi:hypothetical protein
MKTINGERFITPTEVGRLFGVRQKTIIRWCADGSTTDVRPKGSPDLQPVRMPNRRLLFRERHIKELVMRYYGPKR